MTGYVRKDTSNNIADGNIINAADLDAEFDGVQDAFNSSTGHKHDGTSGEGAPITVVGPVQDVVISATAITPKTTNTVDIGSSSLKFKDIFITGTATLPTVSATTIGATTGNITTVNATTVDTTNIEVTNIKAKDGTSAASIADSTGVMTIASAILTTADINGGTIDGVAIGGTTAAAGAFTTLTASSTATLNTLASSGATLTGGSINNMAIGGSTAAAGAFTTLSASGAVTLSGGTANGVAYLNGSKVLTSGSALTFDGNGLSIGTGAAQSVSTINGGTTGGAIKGQRAGVNQWFFGDTAAALGSGTGLISFLYNNDPFIWYSNSTEQMRLTSTGLGIGTSSPAGKLSVNVDASTELITFRSSGGRQIWAHEPGANARPLTIKAQTLTYADDIATRLTIDSSGNLGLGVTPSAWSANNQTLEGPYGAVSLGTSLGTVLSAGAYYNSGWKYKSNGTARAILMDANSMQFLTAPSGTAGNAISFTQAMTLSASGFLGIGTTNPPYGLTVSDAGGVGLEVGPGSQYSAGKLLLQAYNRSGSAYAQMDFSASLFTWLTNGTERARIDSSGNLLVGATSQTYTSAKLYSQGNISLGTGNNNFLYCDGNNTYGGVLKIQAGAGSTGWGGGIVLYGHSNSSYPGSVWIGASSGAGGAIMFGSGGVGPGTEYGRFDSSGNLLVNTTGLDTSNGQGVTLQNYVGGSYITIAHTTSANTGEGFVSFYRASTQIGSIAQLGTTAVAYNTSSDYRLKENVTPLMNALAKVQALKPSEFDWIDGRHDDGFIAHELQAVLPSVVTGDKDAVNEDGSPKYQQVDYARIVPTLCAAIQEQQAIINSLKARLDAANL